MAHSIKAVVVAGLPGAGKTTWIQRQLTQQTDAVFYCCPGAISVDRTVLTSQFPTLQWVEEFQLFEPVVKETVAYVEIGFHLNLAAVAERLKVLPCHRVAVLPPSAHDAEWRDWADELVEGIESEMPETDPQLWRAPLTGQVLDLASLEMFWYELTAGAYGTVQRSKGVFDVSDGRSLHFDFAAGHNTYAELDLPLWSEGRPTRFSGIEAIGEKLNQSAIAQTLEDCCLPDQIIQHYQQQIRESVEESLV